MEASSTTSETNDVCQTSNRASSASDHKDAVLNCSICRKAVTSKKAKLLPCLHTLCSPCEITSMTEGRLTCLSCNQSCEAKDIIDHFLVQNIDLGLEEAKCENCTENAIAKYKCVECGDNLCLECGRAHKRVKVTKDHHLKEIDAGNSSTDGKCVLHPQEDLSWFCVTCNKITCRNCQLECHSGHQYRSLEEHTQGYRNEMTKIMEENRKKLTNLSQIINLADQRMKEVTTSENHMRSELANVVKQIQQTLQERGKHLMSKIEAASNAKRHTYNDVKTAAENIEAMSKQVNYFIEASFMGNNKHSILRSLQLVTATLNRIEKLKQERRSAVNILQMQVQLSINVQCADVVERIKSMGELAMDRIPQINSNSTAATSQQNVAATSGNAPNNLPNATVVNASSASSVLHHQSLAPATAYRPLTTTVGSSLAPMLSGSGHGMQFFMNPNNIPNSYVQRSQMSTAGLPIRQMTVQQPRQQMIGQQPRQMQMNGQPVSQSCQISPQQNTRTIVNQLQQMVQSDSTHSQSSQNVFHAGMPPPYQNVYQNDPRIRFAPQTTGVGMQSCSQQQYFATAPTFQNQLQQHQAVVRQQHQQAVLQQQQQAVAQQAATQQQQQTVAQQQQRAVAQQQAAVSRQQSPVNIQPSPTSSLQQSHLLQHPPRLQQPPRLQYGPAMQNPNLTRIPQNPHSTRVPMIQMLRTPMPLPNNNSSSVQLQRASSPIQVANLLNGANHQMKTSLSPLIPNTNPVGKRRSSGESHPPPYKNRVLGPTIHLSPSPEPRTDTNTSHKNKQETESPEQSLVISSVVSLNKQCKNTVSHLSEENSSISPKLEQEEDTKPCKTPPKSPISAVSIPNANDVTSTSSSNTASTVFDTILGPSTSTKWTNNLTVPPMMIKTSRLARKSISRPLEKLYEKQNVSSTKELETDTKSTISSGLIENVSESSKSPNSDILSNLDDFPMTQAFIPMIDDEDDYVEPHRSSVAESDAFVAPKQENEDNVVNGNNSDKRETPDASEVTTTTDDNRWEDYCSVCQNGGDLMCCEAKDCTRVFHIYDHIPQYAEIPKDQWFCNFCTNINDFKSDEDLIPAEQRMPLHLTPFEQKSCERILLTLYCHPDSEPFHNPVEIGFEDYYKTIKKPIDFSMIRSKLNASIDAERRYLSVEGFFDDLNRVFINCSIFNDPNSDTGKAGKTVGAKYLELVHEYFPDSVHMAQIVKGKRRSRSSLEQKRKRRRLELQSDSDDSSTCSSKRSSPFVKIK